MKTRRSILAALGVAALVGMTAAFTQDSGTLKTAKVGEAAPAFTLKDTAGKDHALGNYKEKIVVLQWINYDCPVCVRVMKSGVAGEMLTELKELDKDIVLLAINSTKNLTAEKTAAYLKNHKYDVPALLDQDGTVGKLYGARTTPHMFVIDKAGVLRYAGAIDDDPSGRSDDSTNYVVNAVKQIIAGETVVPDQTQSYGCSVKYKN